MPKMWSDYWPCMGLMVVQLLAPEHIYIYIWELGLNSPTFFRPETLSPPYPAEKKRPFFGTFFVAPKIGNFFGFLSPKTALPPVLASFSHNACSKTLFLKGFRAFATLHFNQKARNVNNVNSYL